MNDINIRAATADDTQLILDLILALARYEKAEHEALASADDIVEHVLAENSVASALICQQGDTPIGFAVYFFSYSTWLGKPGLFLEDLFVLPEYRSLGAGKRILQHLAGIAVDKGCGRFEWNVLDWNEPAIGFYQSLGAKPQQEWIGYRLQGEALNSLADGAV
ncbi:MAG: GNAT family N-acetyltransferase [Oceanococcus sp.]